jgi:hypothetical protein
MQGCLVEAACTSHDQLRMQAMHDVESLVQAEVTLGCL